MANINKIFQVSSLPQGWHGVLSVSNQNCTQTTQCSTSVINVRRKWNSSFVPEVPKSHNHWSRKFVPSFKNEQLNHCFSKNSASVSKTKSIEKTPASRIQICESQAEVVNLKKEISKLKTENSILNAKIRRLEDESKQKSRQIDKLHEERKELLSLRQKCVRLENTLKENEHLLIKVSNNDKLHKKSFLKKRETFHLPYCKNSATVNQGRSNIKSQITRTEVIKLKDMLHKLQEENRVFQQQIKEKDLEIRRLKLQIKRQIVKVPVTVSSGRLPSSINKSDGKTLMSVKFPPLDTAYEEKQYTSFQIISNKTHHFNSDMAAKSAASSNQASLTKDELKENLNFTESKFATVIPAITPNENLELQVQNMRENFAARRIQRSWRHHQIHVKRRDVVCDNEKAALSIYSILREHKSRKANIVHFFKNCNLSSPTTVGENAIVREIKLSADIIWKNCCN